MDSYVSSLDSLVQSIWDIFSEWNWSSVFLAVFIASLIATRIFTGVQNRPSQIDPIEPQTVRIVPYWVFWIGHSFSIAWDYLGYVESARLNATFP